MLQVEITAMRKQIDPATMPGVESARSYVVDATLLNTTGMISQFSFVVSDPSEYTLGQVYDLKLTPVKADK